MSTPRTHNVMNESINFFYECVKVQFFGKMGTPVCNSIHQSMQCAVGSLRVRMRVRTFLGSRLEADARCP